MSSVDRTGLDYGKADSRQRATSAATDWTARKHYNKGDVSAQRRQPTIICLSNQETGVRSHTRETSVERPNYCCAPSPISRYVFYLIILIFVAFSFVFSFVTSLICLQGH